MGKELCQECKPTGVCWYKKTKSEALELVSATNSSTRGPRKKALIAQGLSLIQAEAIAIGCKEVQRDLELPKLPTRNARRK